jgi:polyhydroxybutyrate depolymerase
VNAEKVKDHSWVGVLANDRTDTRRDTPLMTAPVPQAYDSGMDRARLIALAACLTCSGCNSAANATGSGAGEQQDAASPPEDAGAEPADDQEAPVEEDASPPPEEDSSTPPNGCGLAPGQNDATWKLSWGGLERSFRVHVPKGYDPSVPTAVVFNFHGRNSNAQQQILLTGLLAVADAGGFIAVHPEGVGGTWNAGVCCGEAMDKKIDDVGFTRSMIESLQAQLCIDTHRVFATGLSNGGYMVHRLACEAADRIAGIGSVSGTLGFFACAPSRAVPVYHFHGTADTIVPYDGFGGYTSVDSTMKYWVSNNGCNAKSQVFFQQAEVTCKEWTGCHDDATVRLCTISEGGHQWPGGMTIPGLGNNTNVISASNEVWSFFASHPMP